MCCPQLHSVPFPLSLRKLIERAETNDATYALVVLERELYAIAVAPLLAPDPIAWLCPMFRIDDDFAREIKVYTNLEITFLNSADLFGTTLPNRRAITQMLRNRVLPPKQVIDLRLGRKVSLVTSSLFRPRTHPPSRCCNIARQGTRALSST